MPDEVIYQQIIAQTIASCYLLICFIFLFLKFNLAALVTISWKFSILISVLLLDYMKIEIKQIWELCSYENNFRKPGNLQTTANAKQFVFWQQSNIYLKQILT